MLVVAIAELNMARESGLYTCLSFIGQPYRYVYRRVGLLACWARYYEHGDDACHIRKMVSVLIHIADYRAGGTNSLKKQQSADTLAVILPIWLCTRFWLIAAIYSRMLRAPLRWQMMGAINY